MLDAFLLIAENPRIGFTRPFLPEGMRVFPVQRYLICFCPRDGWIEVVRVIHGAQDINRVFGTESGSD